MGPWGSAAEGCCCGGTASCPRRGAAALGEVCSRLRCCVQRKRRPQRSGCGEGCRLGVGRAGGQLPPNQQALGRVVQEAFPAPAVPCGAGRAGPSPGSASSPRAPGTSEDGADQAAPQQEDGTCSPHPCQGQTGPGTGEQVRHLQPCQGAWGPCDAPRAVLMSPCGAGVSLGAPRVARLCCLTIAAVPRPGDPQPCALADTERGRSDDPGRSWVPAPQPLWGCASTRVITGLCPCQALTPSLWQMPMASTWRRSPRPS